MMRRWSIAIGTQFLLLIYWLCSVTLVLAVLSPIAHIKNGTLEGTIMKSRNGREFAAFLGIPYAQPPLGKLRFEPPKQCDAWTGVRLANKDANPCTQRNVFIHSTEILGDEDCLYLNVYTPKLSSNKIDESQTNYPVMILLHGGGWLTGTGNLDYLGPKFLLDHDIVLVAINYRLGPLGFLSTEDMVSPGNQGLKDQSQSFRWAQENIAAFGGDPNQVTIFGHSAGGGSVHHHVISPLSRGLFHRAISQSGTSVSPWAMSPRPGHAKNQGKKLGKLLDCPTDTSKALVDCLKTKNAYDIIATDYAFQVFDWCPVIPFRPVVERDHPGAFFIEDPVQSLKSGNVADVPWMTGVTTHEGAMKVSAIFGLKDKKFDKLLEDKFMEILPISLLYEHTCPEELIENVTKSIREFYLGNKKIDKSAKWELVDMYSDALFFISTDNAVRIHLEALSSPVYYYLFSYKGSASYSKLFGDLKNDYGVCHSDEQLYLFPIHESLFPDISFTNENHKMVDVMTSLFVNFAKSGNPTPEITPDIPVKWKPVRTSNLEYLHIGSPDNLSMGNNLFLDRVNFWASIPYREKVEPAQHRRRVRNDEL